jgi:branched-chain amino acid transport system substrate-binding protein
MQTDYDSLPGLYAAGLYINGMVAAAAAQQTGGKTEDKDMFIKALRAVALTDTPRGPFHFDHLGNVVGNTYIRRCERKNGKLPNTTIKTTTTSASSGHMTRNGFWNSRSTRAITQR